jgi:hypothetical protein
VKGTVGLSEQELTPGNRERGKKALGLAYHQTTKKSIPSADWRIPAPRLPGRGEGRERTTAEAWGGGGFGPGRAGERENLEANGGRKPRRNGKGSTRNGRV